jgi:hypothetical protein
MLSETMLSYGKIAGRNSDDVTGAAFGDDAVHVFVLWYSAISQCIIWFKFFDLFVDHLID